jgi:hypothetical protein
VLSLEKKTKKIILITSVIGIIIITISFTIYLFVPNLIFVKHVIDDNFWVANYLTFANLDSDNDQDLLGCAYYDNEIAWWEFSENNFTKHVIDNSFTSVIHVHPEDLDIDGDIDILATSEVLDQLAWWENNGTHFIKHIITSSYDHPLRINSIDFDEDGDIDILSTSNNEVSWWENEGDLNFTQHAVSSDPISTLNEHHHFIYAIDLNSDGYLDFVTGGASASNGGLFCWRNEGNGNFTKIIITNNYMRVHEVRTGDMDKDGDLDFICGSFSSDEFNWFENKGNFSLIKHNIAINFDGSNGGFPCDLDRDGDMDVIGLAYDGNKISWFEKVGSNIFNEHVISDDLDRATSCCAFDIDKDSDLDIFTAAGNEVAFWENALLN